MRNQFFYTVISEDPKVESKMEGSFNMEKVIRSVEYEPGKLVILMDDFHPETSMRPTPGKNGKISMVKSVETLSSQIHLNEEDSSRYKAVTQIQ